MADEMIANEMIYVWLGYAAGFILLAGIFLQSLYARRRAAKHMSKP